jgi:hypothetical protein
VEVEWVVNKSLLRRPRSYSLILSGGMNGGASGSMSGKS